jgi:hypothetical protein
VSVNKKPSFLRLQTLDWSSPEFPFGKAIVQTHARVDDKSCLVLEKQIPESECVIGRTDWRPTNVLLKEQHRKHMKRMSGSLLQFFLKKKALDPSLVPAPCLPHF